MEKYLLVFDLGTTGLKSCLYNRFGMLNKSEYLQYQTDYPETGWSVQNPDIWWEITCKATQSIMNSNSISPSSIEGVVFSGHNPSCIFIGEDGQLIEKHVPIYADLRAHNQVQSFTQKLNHERFYSITGGGQILEQYALFKILWFMENRSKQFEKTQYILNTVDYLVMRLTGSYYTDPSQASNTGMFDIINQNWSHEILTSAGIPIQMLPEIKPSIEIIGSISPLASKEIGLPPGIPVIMGGGDVSCSAMGSGVFYPDRYYIYIGSAAWIGTFSESPIFNFSTKLVNFSHVYPHSYALHYQMTGAGIGYQWWKDIAYQNLQNPYSIMDVEASANQLDSEEAIFLPYMRGIWAGHPNPFFRGVFIGLHPGIKRSSMTRAIVEGVCFALRELVELFKSQGKFPHEIRLIGGVAQSAFWRQTLANILQLPILCLSNSQEASALGAAICGMTGVGWLKSPKEGEGLITISEIIEPQVAYYHSYERKYSLFLEFKEHLHSLFSHFHR